MNSSKVKGFQLKVAVYRIRPKAMFWMAQALFKNPMFQMNNQKNLNKKQDNNNNKKKKQEKN